MKRKKRVTTKRRVAKTPIIVKVSLIIIVFFVLFATIFKITEIILTHKSDNFPKLEISLKNVSIEKIDAGSKDTKYPENTITSTINDKTTTYYDVEVKGRGNTTWEQIKKPYQIKFRNKESFFNIDKSKKWTLLANYLDPTYLRNDTAFYLEKILNEEYNMEGSFIELSIDENYRGLYYLSEKVEVDEHRVNLKNDYGTLVELDNIHNETEECSYDSKNTCILFKDFVDEANAPAVKENFIFSLNSLYKKIHLKDYEAISEIIDIGSFAKYYLLNEFAVNPDAYSSSFYLYKDGVEDKIHAGPGWDFDLALGNLLWNSSTIDLDSFYSPFEDMILKHYTTHKDNFQYIDTISTLLYDLMEIPEFEARVKEIYQETLSGKGDEILDYIRSQAEYIKPAVLRDQKRWKSKTNFDEEVDYLIDWVAKRYDHFEQTYGANSDQAPKSPQPSQE